MSLKTIKRLGKAQARAAFLPLVESVMAGSGTVEITVRGKIAAVIVSYEDYQRLLANSKALEPKRSPVGAWSLAGDLEQGSAEIAQRIRRSVDESGRKL